METNEELKTGYYTITIPSEQKSEILKIFEANNIEGIRLGDNHKKESPIYSMVTIDTKQKVEIVIKLGVQINHFEGKVFKPTYDKENFGII